MKRTTLGLLALALLATAALALLPTQRRALADHHEGGEVIHEAMETIAGAYRDLRRGARDASKNAQSADLCATIGAAATAAKTHLPATAATDEQKVLYRKTINELIITMAQAENAALDGDNDKLWELVNHANSIKGVGHEAFIPEDE